MHFAPDEQPGSASTDLANGTNPFTIARSKKGLQVQMVDDALALGVQHAALNINLCDLVVPDSNGAEDRADSFAYRYDGEEFFFRKHIVERHDQQIRQLSERGILVYLIVLTYRHSDMEVNRVMLHPGYDEAAPNRLGAFNTVTPEGRRWLAATMEFIASRWSNPKSDGGRVSGYVVGNEVNSHWFWSNMGRVSMPEFAQDYVRAVRIVHSSVRRFVDWTRVYVSLDHHWKIRYEGGDEKQTFAGRPFLEEFARLVKQGGDFDWHVAYHPYPENLGDPRFWNDRTATDQDDSPRITFRNLPVLMRFLAQESMQFQCSSRRVILSEQGFHTPEGPEGEGLQAAAYCYAYRVVRQLDGIDAFILHRHVDHAQEGGLRLGLWTHQPNSIATPDRKKKIYDCFRAADTPEEDAVFEFALPIVGLKSWPERPVGSPR